MGKTKVVIPHEWVGARHPEITGYTEPYCRKCGIRRNHPLSHLSCGEYRVWKPKNQEKKKDITEVLNNQMDTYEWRR